MIQSLSFVIYLLLLHSVITYAGNYSSIHYSSIQPKGLTVTSFAFNYHDSIPAWVDYNIGKKSVFLNRDIKNLRANKIVDDHEFNLAHNEVIRKVVLPNQTYHPQCSIELLGYTSLNFKYPFDISSRNIEPVAGTASLVFNDEVAFGSSTFTDCYYRAVYENWRPESHPRLPNYWPTVFYCPLYQQSSCDHIQAKSVDIGSSYQTMNMTISFNINSTIWSNTFTGRVFSHKKEFDITGEKPFGDLGICTSIPYSSTDNDKHDANGVLLQEWIRYYLKLGYKVVIYDRDGVNYPFIRDLDMIDDDSIRKNLIYYSNTIRGMFDPASRGTRYDNNEYFGDLLVISKELTMTKGIRWEYQGHDKVWTSTQCRFELKAVYGIKNVVVADFDEFFYCPKAKPTALSQQQYTQALLHKLRQAGIEQASFQQRVVLNTTSSTRNCVIDRSKMKNHNGSILGCFAAYKYPAGIHSIKSIHIDHTCILTGYHQACPTTMPRSNDCRCKSKDVYDCEFIHLSTSNVHFQKTNFYFSKDDYANMLREKSEIYNIIYGE